MFDSAMYGLSNPWMTEDIGYACIGKQLPMATGTLSSGELDGTTDLSTGGAKLKGPLSNDTVEISQKSKDKKMWKGILAVTGLAVAIPLCLKFGKGAVSKCRSGIKNIFSKVKP